jgi:transposase InsO family protein
MFWSFYYTHPRIVGWAMRERMTSDLVEDALAMAMHQRQPGSGLLHHSDRGSQYTGNPYQTLLKDDKILVSMSGAGNCYNNAPMESFFGTLKSERVNHQDYYTRAEARTDLFFYIEAFYNRQRLHSALGYASPLAYEQAHFHQMEPDLTYCP